MAIPLVVNGATFSYPQQGDVGYAAQATAWAKALTNGVLQLGGAYTLLSDLDLSAFGVKAPYFTSKTANPALTGFVRAAKTDKVSFRNNANSADLPLGIDTLDNLAFNGVQVTGQPCAISSQTVAQTGISGATVVNFGTPTLDTDNGVTTGAAWKYTCPTGKGGQYLVTVGVAWTQNTSTGTATFQIRKNATLFKQISTASLAAAASDGRECAYPVVLAAGDTVDVTAQTTAGTISTVPGSGGLVTFSIKRLV